MDYRFGLSQTANVVRILTVGTDVVSELYVAGQGPVPYKLLHVAGQRSGVGLCLILDPDSICHRQ